MVKSRSFQTDLFLSIGTLFILFAICFSVYQYNREKEYKIDIMHSRLQMYNYEMMQTLGTDSVINSDAFNRYVARHNVEGLRITIIDIDGKVLMDSRDLKVDSLGNHLKRTEVQQALHYGNGYDIKRTSESTHTTYFYSATLFNAQNSQIKGKGIIIRAAVPYSTDLTRSLKADSSYLFFSIALTIMLCIVLYYNTSRISRHLGYLREFAVKAEKGEELDHELERKLPDDELGDISHTIITLYWKLRHSEEDKIRIKRQLTQNAAHELKTPAASIQGYLETIIQNPDMDEKQRKHFLERCYAQSERMSKLLLDMAALTKLDEQAQPQKGDNYCRGVEINIASVIQNVLDDTTLQLQSKGIITVLNIPERIPISGDPSLIYSIFRNIIDNIIAYATGANKISIVCIEVEEDGKHSYEFVVSDNGVGVEPQYLPHLFERFYRIDKGRSRKLGGTGLGLAIVKNVVAAYGGTAVAELTPGGGLTIRFSLARF